MVVLGKGSYAKVLLVKEKKTNQIFAMKVLKKKEMIEKGQLNHIQSERDVLVHCRHPFIIKLAHSFQSGKKLYFVMEYAPGGELFNLLSKRGFFTEDQTRFYAAQIVLAIEELHKNNIIYRDLKPENVLLDEKGYIRIADFGLSKGGVQGTQDAHSICGTPEYLAPEMFNEKGHGKPIDFWALGAIIYEMLTGLPPFYTENREELFERIRNKQLELPNQLTEPCKMLLNGLFQKDPNQRLGSFNGWDDVKNHPWFMNVNWNILYRKEYKPPYKPYLNGEEDITGFDPSFTMMSIESQKENIESVGGQTMNIPGFTYNTQENNQINPDINGMEMEQ